MYSRLPGKSILIQLARVTGDFSGTWATMWDSGVLDTIGLNGMFNLLISICQKTSNHYSEISCSHRWDHISPAVVLLVNNRKSWR
jgi:hypothetical protein